MLRIWVAIGQASAHRTRGRLEATVHEARALTKPHLLRGACSPRGLGGDGTDDVDRGTKVTTPPPFLTKSSESRRFWVLPFCARMADSEVG